jgi:hypothetical protein
MSVRTEFSKRYNAHETGIDNQMKAHRITSSRRRANACLPRQPCQLLSGTQRLRAHFSSSHQSRLRPPLLPHHKTLKKLLSIVVVTIPPRTKQASRMPLRIGPMRHPVGNRQHASVPRHSDVTAQTCHWRLGVQPAHPLSTSMAHEATFVICVNLSLWIAAHTLFQGPSGGQCDRKKVSAGE